MSLRKIEIVRAVWGASLLLAPNTVLRRVHHLSVDDTSVRVARVLGARQLAQAALSGINPDPQVLAMGIWVDAVHCLSAIALAGLDRSRARAGFSDAAVAGIWAAVAYHDLTQPAGTSTTATNHRQRQRLRSMLAGWALGRLPGGRRLLRAAQ